MSNIAATPYTDLKPTACYKDGSVPSKQHSCATTQNNGVLHLLPTALLGLPIGVKEDLRCSPTELIYGTQLRIQENFCILKTKWKPTHQHFYYSYDNKFKIFHHHQEGSMEKPKFLSLHNSSAARTFFFANLVCCCAHKIISGS